MTTKTQREQDQEDLREIQDSNDRRRRESTRPAEVHEDVVASVFDDESGEAGSEKRGEIHVLGGRVYAKVDGEFSQDDWLVFSQQVQKASQAVQV